MYSTYKTTRQEAMEYLSSKYDDLDIGIFPKQNKISIKENGKIYSKFCNLTLSDIRNQLRAIGFYKPYNSSNYSEYKSEKLENSNIPYFNYVYYKLFCMNLRIPTMNEIVNTYIREYCINVYGDWYQIRDEYFYDKSEPFVFTKKALIGRVFRAYNSYHREIELLFQLAEYSDMDIRYQFKADLDGVDIIIYHNNKKYGIATYVGTSRSSSYKSKKNKYRHDYEGFEMIDLILQFGVNDVDYRGISLYSPVFVKKFIEEIQNT